MMHEVLEKIKELAELAAQVEENGKVTVKPQAGKVQLSALAKGDVFKIGERDFIVLKQTDGETAVISKNLMKEHVKFGDDRNYIISDVRKIIEEEIQPVMEAAVGADNLVEHEVDLTSVDMQNEFGSLKCKVRLITFDEAREYNDLLVNKDLLDWWWTLTPWSTAERGWKNSVIAVSKSGVIGNEFCGAHIGVRTFCILKSNIFVSKG